MLNEKNPLLNIKLKEKNKLLSSKFDDLLEGLFELYDFILQDPIENYWYECFSVLLSYLQLISFLFGESVSLL